MPYVVVSIGGEELSRHRLAGPTIVGRSVDADVSIRDASMSRWHCKIETAGDPPNVWTLTDLGSRNGTTVNGRKVTRHILHPGDLFRVGRVTVAFMAGELVPANTKPHSTPSRSTRPAQPAPSDSPSSAPNAGFPRPLFVPENRLPRPHPAHGDAKRSATSALSDLEMMSSPGWSRQAGKKPPSPSVDLSPSEFAAHDRTKTVDLVKVPLAAGELPEVVAADPPKHSPLRKVWNWLAGR